MLDSVEKKNIPQGTSLLFSEAKPKALGVLLDRKSNLFVVFAPIWKSDLITKSFQTQLYEELLLLTSSGCTLSSTHTAAEAMSRWMCHIQWQMASELKDLKYTPLWQFMLHTHSSAALERKDFNVGMTALFKVFYT